MQCQVLLSLSPLPAVRSGRAIPDAGCPSTPEHEESWQRAALRDDLPPHPLHGLQPARGDAAKCPSSYWQGGDLRGV